MRINYKKHSHTAYSTQNGRSTAGALKQLYYITFLTFVNEIKILSA